jgi:hypothetical protein
MTCRNAFRLMERMLDGDGEDVDGDELQDHLRECDYCARAWETARQVRSLMRDCEPKDPGEAYFDQVTERIMARIQGMAGASQDAPMVGSMRYGPLAMRGAGASFVLTLALLVGAFTFGGDEPLGRAPSPDARDACPLPALTLATSAAHHQGVALAAANHRADAIVVARNAAGRTRIPVLPVARAALVQSRWPVCLTPSPLPTM